MKTTIEFFPSKQVPSRRGAWWIEGFRFASGLNEVPEKVFAQVKNNDTFKQFVEDGILVILKTTLENSSPEKAEEKAPVKPPKKIVFSKEFISDEKEPETQTNSENNN